MFFLAPKKKKNETHFSNRLQRNNRFIFNNLLECKFSSKVAFNDVEVISKFVSLIFLFDLYYLLIFVFYV